MDGVIHMDQEDRLTHSVVEMARLLGVGRTTAYGLVRSGAVPSIRLGNRILIPKLALRQLLAGCGTITSDMDTEGIMDPTHRSVTRRRDGHGKRIR